MIALARIKANLMDPEWAAYAECPHCRFLSMGCCREHATDDVIEHIEEEH